MNKWKPLILLIVILFVVDIAFGQGCSQCKLLAEQGSELDEDSFGTNINYGIMFLMAMPYVIIGTAVAIILISVRRKKKKQELLDSSASSLKQ